MSNVDLPTHLTLVANTVASVDINGLWTRLHVVTDVGGTLVYARGDATDPVTTPADRNYAIFPSPAAWECVPAALTASNTTNIRFKSTGTPVVHIKPCDCE